MNWWTSWTHHQYIRSELVPSLGIFVTTKLHITMLNNIVSLAAGIILLFILFVDLLRLRLNERSAFSLGRFLWRQVGYYCFSLAVV